MGMIEMIRREVDRLRTECAMLRAQLAEKQIHLDDAVRRLEVAERDIALLAEGCRVLWHEHGETYRPGTVQEVDREYGRAFVVLDGPSPRETVCVPIQTLQIVRVAK